MVDFRYHALSLVAVFLALGIGIVLGVTVGDSLVSEADQNLRDSLREDVTEAREQVREQQDLGARRDEVIDETAAEIADGRLGDTRIALVAVGELPAAIADSVDEAIEIGGGKLVRQAEINPLPEAENLLPDLPPRTVLDRVNGQRRSGVIIVRAIESGGRVLRELHRDTSQNFSGSARGPVDGVVVYRHPPADDESDEDAALRDGLTDGVFQRLGETAIAVEALATEPSQVSFYDDQAIASVDNVDTPAGELALVLLLEKAVVAEITGEPPEGSYGYKDTADSALPELQ